MIGRALALAFLWLLGAAAIAQAGTPPRREGVSQGASPSQVQGETPSLPGTGFGLGIDLSFRAIPKVKAAPLPGTGGFEARDAVIPDSLEHQVIIVLDGIEPDPGRISRSADIAVLEAVNLQSIARTMLVARLPPGEGVDTAIIRLQKIPGVAWAQPDFLFQPLGEALPPRFTLHGITSPGQVRTSGTIAMIDTPVEISNEALRGAAVRQTFFGTSAQPAFHGTAIASLLVGDGETAGMSQGATLYSLAAFDPTASASGISQTRYVAKAMDAAWRLRPDVLNLSFGGKEDRLLGAMLDAIYSRGICVVAAVGNGGPNGAVLFPASHPASLAVTAADEKMRAYAFASHGSRIDVTGIGVDLLATVPGGYRQVSGTSFATAIVSGAVLRMPACARDHDPAAMRRNAASLALDLGAPGPDPVFGAGLFRLTAPAKARQHLP